MTALGLNRCQKPRQFVVGFTGVLVFLSLVTAATMVIVQQPHVFGTELTLSKRLQHVIVPRYERFFTKQKVTNLRLVCQTETGRKGVLVGSVWTDTAIEPGVVRTSVPCDSELALSVVHDIDTGKTVVYSEVDSHQEGDYHPEKLARAMEQITARYH